MVEKPYIVAIIPARGGSKSIPRKNIRTLNEHPLIAYSIAAGQASKHVDRVLVSTDDEAVAAVALRYKAEVPFLRPSELAQDQTTDLPVFLHALEWMKSHEGAMPDIVVQLRPTSPFRPRDCVDGAIETLLRDNQADSVRGVTPSGQNPYKMWRLDGSLMKPLLETDFAEPYNMLRQALPETYWQTGHVEVIRTRTLVDQGSMTGNHIAPYVIDPAYALDLDTLVQWRYAEFMMTHGELEICTPQDTLDARLKQTELVIFDFDGVFTDDQVITDETGKESVRCHRGDGMGIALLEKAGIPCLVLSSETNGVVAARARKLGIPCHHGVTDKGKALEEICGSLDVTLETTAYVGNDVNDIGPMNKAGLAVAVNDAHPDLLPWAHWKLNKNGGSGAVREFCDRLIQSKRERGEDL